MLEIPLRGGSKSSEVDGWRQLCGREGGEGYVWGEKGAEGEFESSSRLGENISRMYEGPGMGKAPVSL